MPRKATSFIASIGLLILADLAVAAPPKLSGLFPPGLGRGQSVVVDAAGEFAEWPPQVWISRSGLTVVPAADKGKLQVSAAADALPGVAWLRLYNGDGTSSPRPMMIGHFAESVEEEPNDKPEQTKVLELPRVVAGRLAKRGDADCFRVRLKQGQQLVAAVQANHLLGSPLDALVQVCLLRSRTSERLGTAREEAFVLDQNHDSAGPDPRVVCTAPSDGEYLVRVFGFPVEADAGIALAGNAQYIYRLTLTTGEYIAQTLPSAIQRAEPGRTVQLFGHNLSASITALQINLQSENALTLTDDLALAFHPVWPGMMPLAVIDHPSIVAEDAASLQAPQAITLPTTISGRLKSRGDSDAFRFTLKKDDKLRTSAQSRAVGAGLYPVVQIIDSAGKNLASYQADSTQRDFVSVFTTPSDGAYTLNLLDAGDSEGETGFYRLTLEPVVSDYGLTVPADNFVLTIGTPLELPLKVDRRDGFAEPIEIRAENLPPGVTADTVVSQRDGDSAKQVKLVLKSDAAAAPSSAPILIRAKSTGTSAIEHVARYSIGLPGAGSRSDVWLTVKK